MNLEKIIRLLIILLFSWFLINGLVVTFWGEMIYGTVSKTKIVLSFLLLVLVQKRYNLSSNLICYRTITFIWFAYFCFFLYHTDWANISSVSPHLESGMQTVLYRGFPLSTVFYLAFSVYVKEREPQINSLLNSLMFFQTIANVALFILIYIKHGTFFFLNEAIVLDGGVTLIMFSYSIVVTINIGLYLLISIKKKSSKIVTFLFVIINLFLLFSMGKRGALLSVIIPMICLWLFANKTKKQSLLYLFVGLLIYILVIMNIDTVFQFLGYFNLRIGTQMAAFYHDGDLNGRDSLWEYATLHFLRNPFFGYYPRLVDVPYSYWGYGMHPHNIWLEILMTMGLVGGIPLFSYMIYVLFGNVYIAIKASTPYRFFAILFLSEAVHGSVSGAFNLNLIWLAMFVLAGFNIKKNEKINR